MIVLAPFLALVLVLASASPTSAPIIPAVPKATASRTSAPTSEAPSTPGTSGDVSSAGATPRPSSSAPPVPARVSSLSGVASWYRWRPNEAAAGPGLRRALGAHWRGSIVQVCARGRCVVVRLTDYCGCPNGRLVDLDAGSFSELAPLSRGLLEVAISW